MTRITKQLKQPRPPAPLPARPTAAHHRGAMWVGDRLLLLGRADGDSGGDSGAPWTPAQLSGLHLLLDSSMLSAIDGHAIASWPDTSGLGRDMSAPGLSNRPVFDADGLGGGPAVVFDGTDDFLRLADPDLLGELAGTSFGFALVFRCGASGGTICDGPPGRTWLLTYGGDSFHVLRAPTGVETAAAVNDSQPHIVFYTCTGAAGSLAETLRLDGTVSTGSGGTDGTATGGAWTLFAHSDDSDGSEGTVPGAVGLAVFIDHAWTDSEVASLTAYASAKWGTPA